MKIAQIISTFPPYKGGMGNVACEFARRLNNRGNEITVLTPFYEKIEELGEGFTIKRLKPFFKYGNAAFIPGLWSELDNYEIIHLHYPFFGAAEIVLLKMIFSRPKFKLFIHYHMDAKPDSIIKKIIFGFYRYFVLPGLVKRAKGITVGLSDYVKNSEIKDLYKRYEYKFKETYYGVDYEAFSPRDRGVSAIDKILFVGGLDAPHYFKGLDVLLEAFSLICRNNKEIMLEIVGEGDRKEFYKGLVRNLKIENQVVFSGKKDFKELTEIYRNSDLFILPSINMGEAFGLVLIEAMASGLPVIASRLPGVRSVFIENEHGLLAEPGNSDDLKNKIDAIVKNPEKASEMGRRGREYVLEKYDWNKIILKIEDFYKL